MALVDTPTYQTLSGDFTTQGPEIVVALAAAQTLLEEHLQRGLESMTRTEQVRIHYDGRAYPTSTPITSVTSPTTAVVMDGTVVGSLMADQNPLWDVLVEPYHYGPGGAGGEFDTTMRPSTITYVGGYTPDNLPRKLRQAIVELAQVELRTFDPAAAGVRMATVGDTSVQYTDAPTRAGVTDAILATVKGFVKKEIGH
jgi:hypothetical protein